MSAAAVYPVTDQFARTPTGGAGMPDRHTASTITDDALDALYARLDAAESTTEQDYECRGTCGSTAESWECTCPPPNTELEQLRAENERLRAQQAGFFAQMAAARQQNRHWWQRAQAAERAVERVEALHTRGPRTNTCNEDGAYWPCETVAVLTGQQPYTTAQEVAR